MRWKLVVRRTLSAWSKQVALALCVFTIQFSQLADSASGQASVAADIEDRARALGESGLVAYRNGDYAAALERFDRAYALLAVPMVGVWSARAAVKLGKFIEASARYREVTRGGALVGDLEIQRKAQRDAGIELAELTPRIPSLTVHITGAEAHEIEVSLDGVRLPAESLGESRALNPGRHVIEATRGQERHQGEVTLVEGQPARASFRFVVAAPPQGPSMEVAAPVRSDAPPQPIPDEPQPAPARAFDTTLRTVGVGALIASGVAVAASAITAGLALDQKGSIVGCVDDHCPTRYHRELESYNDLRTVSTIAFYGAVGLGVAGLGMLLIPQHTARAHERQLSMQLGPTSASIAGVW